MHKKPIILDCDPGHDDVMAILLAANSPKINLLGITTVAGNATIERTTNNALKFCTLAEIFDVPVAAGMSRGIVMSDRFDTDSQIHGKSGLGGYELPDPKLNKISKHAVQFIIDEVNSHSEPVTLIPTGPFSNIAMALLLNPSVKENIEEVILMGGSIGIGNRTPAAEFNVWADPEAASVVFNSGLPITMIGLEATHSAQLYDSDVNKFSKYQHPLGEALSGLMEFAMERYQKTYRTKGLPVHDICTVAGAIDRNLLVLEKMSVEVELDGSLTKGRTVCDRYDKLGKKQNAEVAVDLDGNKIINMIYEVLDSYEK